MALSGQAKNDLKRGLGATNSGREIASAIDAASLELSTDLNIPDTYGILVGAATQETTSYDGATDVVPELQLLGTAADDSSMMLVCFSLTATIAATPIYHLVKSGDAAIDGTHVVVTDNEILGAIQWHGDDGTDLEAIAGQITVEVDGTPGTGDMPGAMVFATTVSGAETATESFRITGIQNVVIANGNGLSIGAEAFEVTSTDGSTDVTPEFQIQGTTAGDSSMMISCNSTTATIAAAPVYHLVKGGNATIGSHTIVTDGEVLGGIMAHGDDGVDYEAIGADIQFVVDGTPAAGKMPSKIVLGTAGDDAETTTSRIEITKEGLVVPAGQSIMHARNRESYYEDFRLDAGATEVLPLAVDVQNNCTLDFVSNTSNWNIVSESTSQAQAGQLTFGDTLVVDITKNPVIEARFKWNFPGAAPTADERLVFGVCPAHAAAETALDNIDHSVWFKMEGVDLKIFVEADDASTDTDDQDSTISFADDTFITARIDLSTLTDIKFYVDGVEQGGAAVSAASLTGNVQPILCWQRDAGAEVNTITIDYLYMEWDR